jgi:hypothetical protein
VSSSFIRVRNDQGQVMMVNVDDISSAHPHSGYDNNRTVIYMKNPPTKIYTTMTVDNIMELIADGYRVGTHAQQIARD